MSRDSLVGMDRQVLFSNEINPWFQTSVLPRVEEMSVDRALHVLNMNRIFRESKTGRTFLQQ